MSTNNQLNSPQPFTLAVGGTGHALTASAGGIVWSDSSKLNILAGTSTAGQLLLSGNAATPAWSTSTYPSTNAVNTLLYASSANVMAALATANSSVLITSSGGVPSLSTTLPNGIAATGMVLTTPKIITGINDTNGNPMLNFSPASSPVNYFLFFNAATGSGPAIYAHGTDTNVPFNLSSQGNGNIYLYGENGGSTISVFTPVASAVNYISFSNNTTGNPPSISTVGSDTNVNLYINPQGSGKLQLGNAASFSANNTTATVLGSLGPTGAHTTVQTWLTIVDNGGTTRYIPCF
jgi:hypothetical protein